MVHRHPVYKNSLVRIFGAYKDASTHRQIGDKRGRNAMEGKVSGPSSELPSGADFAELCIDPRTQNISITITDRRDFYHQLKCTASRARANTIGPSVPESMVSDTAAFAVFLLSDSRKKYDRLRQGDRLGHTDDPDIIELPGGEVWLSFKSVLQGDHLGVEVATQSHANLLKGYGLLSDDVRMTASRPLRCSSHAEGLVIDDFFAVTVQDRCNSQRPRSLLCYDTAQKAYRDFQILGSPQKDIIGSPEGKVIGAYINGAQRATSRNLVTLAAPAEKRLALSYLTLLTCQLRGTTDSLHLCTMGGWVSVLGYRRPLMSVLQKAFNLVNALDFDKNSPKVIHLPRSVANEMTLLAVLMPLAMVDLTAEFDQHIYCSDASCQRGAVLRAQVSSRLTEVLWKCSRSKGAYTRLQTPSESLLQALDLEKGDISERQVDRPLACHFEFVEVFAGAAKVSHYVSSLGITVGPALDLSQSSEYDLLESRVIEWLTFMISQKRLLGFMLSPPCTSFSIMRRPRLRSADQPFGFNTQDKQTHVGTALAQRSFQLLAVGDRNASAGILETPHSSYMKHLPSWQKLKARNTVNETRCDSCRYNSPHLKSFRFLGLRVNLDKVSLRCACTDRHVVVEGGLTKGSATYTDALASALAETIADGISKLKEDLFEVNSLQVKGLESQLVNSIMISSKWEVLASWRFRQESHINILEEAAVLKLCQKIAARGKPVRVTLIVDSHVAQASTNKGRTSSRGLGSILRRVAAICLAAGIYLHVAYIPTRLNAADDPTRSCALRPPGDSLNLDDWSTEDLFRLGAFSKLRKWASNWARLVLRLLGPLVLRLHDRSLFQQSWGSSIGFECKTPLSSHSLLSDPVNDVDDTISLDFDSTLGFPGEGPKPLIPFCPKVGPSGFHKIRRRNARPCRLDFPHTRSAGFFPRLICLVSFVFSPWGVLLLCCSGALRNAEAMPISATTPGEVRKSAFRSQQPPLVSGRPVTEATNLLRQKYWKTFIDWTKEEDIDFDEMLADAQHCIEEINIVMTKFGRLLYRSGKSYNQYAETLNSLGSLKPGIRRLLQQSWDLGYSWVRSEPSNHHVALPAAVLISMITVALSWGWLSVAGCLALGFGGLLRPGEITAAIRRDLLTPRDVGFSTNFCLLSIREPKSRFTYARHQSAKVDASDLVAVIDLAFKDLAPYDKLWQYSAQTLRTRFKSLLQALRLPIRSTPELRMLDLGSLRSGGATYIILTTEDSELCRRRGRWSSMKMMDIYVQETMALQFMKLIPDSSRTHVLEVATFFHQVLQRSKSFADAKIPETIWFFLHSK